MAGTKRGGKRKAAAVSDEPLGEYQRSSVDRNKPPIVARQSYLEQYFWSCSNRLRTFILVF